MDARVTATRNETAVPHTPPLRIAVLCNPGSGRCQAGLSGIRSLARAIAGTRYAEAGTPQAVQEAIDRFHARNMDLLVVIGGDGTLAMVITALHMAGKPLPALALVAAGTANTTALDLGLRDTPGAALMRLQHYLRMPPAQPVYQQRAAIKVTQGGVAPRYGMVFGLGAIAASVDRFRSAGNRSGMTGERASMAAFGSAMGALLLGRFRGALAPVPMTVEIDQAEPVSDNYLMALVSSLDRMLFGLRPYWGDETAPLHYTAITHPPRFLRRSLPALLRGRRHRHLHPANGYHSANVSRVTCHLEGAYMLDGEVYPVRQGNGPLRIEAQPPLRFLMT